MPPVETSARLPSDTINRGKRQRYYVIQVDGVEIVMPAVVPCNTDGDEIGTADFPFRTDPTGVTNQPVSAETWPLPTGASREAGGNLEAILGRLTPPSTVTITEPDFTTISDTTRNVTLLAANASRRSVTIVNLSSRPIPVREGGVATSRAYSRMIRPGADVTLDLNSIGTGAINAYFAELPDGRVFVTERT